MDVLTDNAAPPSRHSSARPTRASLKTRPRIQRACIRSWEYIQPVRVSVLVVRLMVVVWLFVLGTILMSAGYTWGWTMFLAAGAVLAVAMWVYAVASRGWPVDGA
jgi:hypothetical protein